jgi:hypothetical protein
MHHFQDNPAHSSGLIRFQLEPLLVALERLSNKTREGVKEQGGLTLCKFTIFPKKLHFETLLGLPTTLCRSSSVSRMERSRKFQECKDALVACFSEIVIPRHCDSKLAVGPAIHLQRLLQLPPVMLQILLLIYLDLDISSW